ncbi:hypothetical protein ACFLSQ_09200 [Bacteroidota bacterium]
MIRKFTLVLTVSAIIIAAMSGITLSQNLAFIEKNGFTLTSKTDSTYNFSAKCVSNDDEYFLGFIALSVQDNGVCSFFSVVYNSDLQQLSLTDEEIDKIVNSMNKVLPEDFWYSYIPQFKKLSLHYIIYADYLQYINDETTQMSMIDIFDMLLNCACSLDILTAKRNLSESMIIDQDGHRINGNAEVLKKFMELSNKFIVKIPDINIGK